MLTSHHVQNAEFRHGIGHNNNTCMIPMIVLHWVAWPINKLSDR